jgi:hypothetical protein
VEELRALRAFERIEQLKSEKAWSFRQPKKQRIGAAPKAHWDHLLDEMVRPSSLLSFPLLTLVFPRRDGSRPTSGKNIVGRSRRLIRSLEQSRHGIVHRQKTDLRTASKLDLPTSSPSTTSLHRPRSPVSRRSCRLQKTSRWQVSTKSQSSRRASRNDWPRSSQRASQRRRAIWTPMEKQMRMEKRRMRVDQLLPSPSRSKERSSSPRHPQLPRTPSAPKQQHSTSRLSSRSAHPSSNSVPKSPSSTLAPSRHSTTMSPPPSPTSSPTFRSTVTPMRPTSATRSRRRGQGG